ncbi:hypothetical protein [Arthrobacter sp. PAMC25564]|nr:hypothetical protein [Arthrobacter sp. PAMC25564]
MGPAAVGLLVGGLASKHGEWFTMTPAQAAVPFEPFEPGTQFLFVPAS